MLIGVSLLDNKTCSQVVAIGACQLDVDGVGVDVDVVVVVVVAVLAPSCC